MEAEREGMETVISTPSCLYAPPQQLRGRTTEVVAEANGGRERGDGDGNLHTFLLIR